jgi:hypothetical protein
VNCVWLRALKASRRTRYGLTHGRTARQNSSVAVLMPSGPSSSPFANRSTSAA